MARCGVTTRKGTNCRLNALRRSYYCAVHFDQDSEASSGYEAIDKPEDHLSETVKTLLGFAIVFGIVLAGLIRQH